MMIGIDRLALGLVGKKECLGPSKAYSSGHKINAGPSVSVLGVEYVPFD